MIKDIVRALGFRRTALVASVALPLVVSFSALAQTPGPSAAAGPSAAPAPQIAGEASAERVIVTGSNIPTAEEVTASPVDTLNTQEIARSGSQDILTVLQKRNPDFTSGGNLGTSNANIASGSTLGGTVISIRGFPSLTLYEGRRIADSAAISAGGAAFSDVSIFPAALISRIEVLKDGASALYGSEAVGGVINIFTKDDFQGAEVGFRYGTTLEGAVAERRAYVIAGAGNETTQIMAAMQYYEIDPLFERQRAYSNPTTGGTTNFAGSNRSAAADPLNPLDTRSPNGRYLIIGETPANFPGPIVANSPFSPGVIPPVVPGAIPVGTGFEAIPQFYRPASTGEVLSFNLALRPTSTIDTSRTNVVASVDHQVFGKQLELFGNFLYSNADYQSRLNAQPLSNGTGVVILGSQRVDPLTGLIVAENRGAPAPFNPFQLSIDGNTLAGPNRLIVTNRYNSFDRPPRIFDNTNNFYRFLGGVRSQITPDWTFEAAGYYSKYDINYVNRNLFIASQLNAMIAGTALDAQGAAIPALDFFAVNPIGTDPGQVTKAQFNTLYGANLRSLSSFQRVFDAKLTGFPFELPGGKIGVSVGAEFRVEGFKVIDSPEIFVGSVPIGNIAVGRDIYSAFAEVRIPIVGESMHVPGVYNLELTLAGRYDQYQGVSEDSKVPKVSLRYQPIKDLTLRATYSTSFIAPTLFETQGPQIAGFSNGITINNKPQDQAQVLAGSNPLLTPAKAETYTAGLVYSPSFLPGFVLTADYFRTLEQNVIGVLGGNLIIQDTNSKGPASPYASLVSFNNFPGRPGAQPVTAPNQLDGNLASVFYIDNLRNLGVSRAEGFDLSVHYTIDLKTFGQLELGCQSIIFNTYDAKTLPFHSQYYNVLGLTAEEGLGTTPQYRITGTGEYRWQGFTASLIVNYIPKVINAVGQDPEFGDQSTFPVVQDYIVFDGRLSYTFVRTGEVATAAAVDTKDSKSMRDGKAGPAPVAGTTLSVLDRILNGTTLAVGCNNIFDRTPPFVEGANSQTDLSVYDPFGRFLYFEIAKKF